MTNVQFSGQTLTQVKFGKANLTNANFKNTTLDYITILNSNLTNAVFYNAKMDSCDFRICNFEGANIAEAKIINFKFKEEDLLKCSLFDRLEGIDDEVLKRVRDTKEAPWKKESDN